MIMKIPFALTAFIALAYSGWGAPAVLAQTPTTKIRAVVSEGEAYLPGPVHMITPAQTKSVIVHPQGRYALVVQNEAALPPYQVSGPITGSASLLLYDARTGKTKTLWEQKANGAVKAVAIGDIQWLPGTDCAVVTTSVRSAESEGSIKSTNSLLYFNFEKSLVARRLISGVSPLQISVSPKKPLFLVKTFPDENSTSNQARFVTVRGTFGPSRVADDVAIQGWNPEGTSVYGSELLSSTEPDGKEKKTARWFAWNGETGAETPLPGRPARTPYLSDVPTLPIRLVTTAATLPAREKNTAPDTLRPLYLEAVASADTPDTPNRSLLLAPHADTFYLLPDKSAALFEADGALYAVPLVRMKATAFAEAQKAALRQEALVHGKQVALGILMYSQDYDEVMPPQAGFADAIKPYLKNTDLLNGFTYVGGGPLAKIESPATTVMGYVSAPGGRAVVYADGHCKWEDGK